MSQEGAAAATRVFVLTSWLELSGPVADRKFVYLIDGQSWPFTERLTQPAGETARWR